MQSTRKTVFDNVYYKQIDVVTVGSPLGPTLVNLLLPYSKRKRLDNCPIQFRPRHYRRYVYDIFVMFECQDHVKNTA